MAQAANRCKVLIVDDEDPMRMLLAQIMRQDLDAEVTLAGTCERALNLIYEKNYDVILLDLLMPGIGGFEVLKRIRANSVNKSTPVIVVSVLATSLYGNAPVSVENAKALGASAVIPKPVNRNTLVAAVKMQLGMKV
jgi:CheY-like chemotaxis protein